MNKMNKPTPAQLKHWQYSCRFCDFSSPTVGLLFDHISQLHEKGPKPVARGRMPLIVPPQSAPQPPPPPEVDVEDFIQYNTIIRPGGEEVAIKEEDLVCTEPSVSAPESLPPQPASEIFACPLCKFESRNHGKVLRHINRHYEKEEVESTATKLVLCNEDRQAVDQGADQGLPDDGIYECGLCHVQYGSIQEMIQHMVVAHQIQ